jgi:hypothetical protein
MVHRYIRDGSLFRENAAARHLVSSMPAPVASGRSVRRVGLSPTGKHHLFTAHGTRNHLYRIIDDQLWQKVKARQQEARIEMGKDQAGNTLNQAHRRKFLLRASCSSVASAAAGTWS